MGKEKTTEVVDLEKEIGNIEENLDKEIALNKEAISEAAKGISQKRKDILVEEATKAIYKSEYLQETQRLYTQKKKRELNADKDYLATIGKDGLDKELRSGTLTPQEYNEKVKAAGTKKYDAYKESNKRFNAYKEKLQLKYRNYWTLGWDDPIWEATGRY